MSPELTMYTREGCHLCEDMLQELNYRRESQAFTLHLVDIAGKPELESLYGTKVPVLTHAGEEICNYYLDGVAFQACFEDR